MGSTLRRFVAVLLLVCAAALALATLSAGVQFEATPNPLKQSAASLSAEPGAESGAEPLRGSQLQLPALLQREGDRSSDGSRVLVPGNTAFKVLTA